MFKQFIYILAAASFIFGASRPGAGCRGIARSACPQKIITDQEAEEVRADLKKRRQRLRRENGNCRRQSRSWNSMATRVCATSTVVGRRR